MATHIIRKGSPFFWIQFKRGDGTWGRRSSGIRIAEEGSLRRVMQAVAEQTAKEAVLSDDGANVMFRRWVPGWIDYNYANLNSRKRCKNAWAHISVFFEARRITHPLDVSYSLAHEYMRWRTSEKMAKEGGRRVAAWNSAVMEVRFLGSVLQECLRRGWVTANPCARLGLAKRPAKEKVVISREDEVVIFREFKKRRRASPWMEEAFLVAMRQGCRLSEVEVPFSRIDTGAMVITFKVKGGKLHAAPLHKDLLPLVAKALAEGRRCLVELPSQPSPRYLEFFKLIGFGKLCFHCTRVTVVSRLCEAGFSESQTMAYVGHASEAVHAVYRKMRPVAVAKLGDVL